MLLPATPAWAQNSRYGGGSYTANSYSSTSYQTPGRRKAATALPRPAWRKGAEPLSHWRNSFSARRAPDTAGAPSAYDYTGYAGYYGAYASTPAEAGEEEAEAEAEQTDETAEADPKAAEAAAAKRP